MHLLDRFSDGVADSNFTNLKRYNEGRRQV